MEKMTQNTNPSIPRDYDKDPIVVVDRMPEIGILVFISFIIIVFSIFFTYMNHMNKIIDWTHIIIMVSIMIFPPYFMQRKILMGNRSIIFSKDRLTRKWNDETIEIEWSNIKSVKRGFIDYYDIRQDAIPPVKLFFPIYAPFMILIYHPIVLITKQLMKIVKGYKCDLIDTLFIVDNKDNMIVVFIENDSSYKELKTYFGFHNINIDTLGIFYYVMYVFLGNNQLFTAKGE